MSTCILCEQQPAIKNSHVIPQFVYRRMKAGSPVKTLRHSSAPGRPIQDGVKKPYLCNACEEKFSSWETWFCNNVYDPFRIHSAAKIAYGHELMLFWASEHFRYMRHVFDENAGKDQSAFLKLFQSAKDSCLAGVPSNRLYLYHWFLHDVTSISDGPIGINSYWFAVSDGYLFDWHCPDGHMLHMSFVKLPYVASIAADRDLSVIIKDPAMLVPAALAAGGVLDPAASEAVLRMLTDEHTLSRCEDVMKHENAIPAGQRVAIQANIDADPNHSEKDRHRIYMLDKELLRQSQERA